MSMFQSPYDDSTSDPESSSDEENLQNSSGGNEKPKIPDGDIGDTADDPLEWEETASESLPEHEAFGSSEDWLPNTAEQHATLLTSSLLEFAYDVKAAEHLNHAQGTTRFHRESPEAKALGSRMYEGASRVLVSSGIIADCVHEEDWKEMRQQYIIGVDNLGLQAFNESRLGQTSPRRGRPARPNQNVMIRRSSRPRQEFTNLLSSTYLPSQFADVQKHREMMDAMVRKLKIPSPLVDMQLTLSPSAAAGNRYTTEFQELKQVGKGGFGTVYHVRNFVDNQDYAVKKIPLHSRLLKRWQTRGVEEFENLLKEIRTLARLEHGNIVRYYSAWIEVNDGPMATANATKQHQQLHPKPKLALPDKPSTPTKGQQKKLPTQEWQEEDSIDVAFKGSTLPRSLSLQNIGYNESMGVVFGEDTDDLSQKSERGQQQGPAMSQISQDQNWNNHYSNSTRLLSNETDIFTNGEGQLHSAIKKHDTVEEPVMTLHIQMSLHPLSLSQYLVPSNQSSGPSQPRHCFHLRPSLLLIRAILSGVQYLHSQGIIHRDLKPGNVFLSEHREYDQRPGCIDITCSDCATGPPGSSRPGKRFLNPRIGDFGLVDEISGVSDPPNPTTPSSSSSNTCPNKAKTKAVGTEFYRPPPPPPPSPPSESPRNHPNQRQAPAVVDEKLDVFALGILLFELLWKMNTKMERHMLLTDLSKKAVLPQRFKGKVDPRRRRVVRAGDDGGGGEASMEGAESWTVGESVQDCIRNMVCACPVRRWGCVKVRERLDELIGLLDE